MAGPCSRAPLGSAPWPRPCLSCGSTAHKARGAQLLPRLRGLLPAPHMGRGERKRPRARSPAPRPTSPPHDHRAHGVRAKRGLSSLRILSLGRSQVGCWRCRDATWNPSSAVVLSPALRPPGVIVDVLNLWASGQQSFRLAGQAPRPSPPLTPSPSRHLDSSAYSLEREPEQFSGLCGSAHLNPAALPDCASDWTPGPTRPPGALPTRGCVCVSPAGSPCGKPTTPGGPAFSSDGTD